MNINEKHQRTLLERVAHQAMIEAGLLPDFSKETLTELEKLQKPKAITAGPIEDRSSIRDMRNLLWSSIDNDNSRDLDQLTVAESLSDRKTRVMIAIADVDAFVKEGSAINEHACHNTTSVYTAVRIFSMIPERLSTDLTSLNFNQERLALVVEIVIDADGNVLDSDIYRAYVLNHAKLTYNSVAAWLDGNGTIPKAVASIQGLDENLRIQDKAAQSMNKLRHMHGALRLETIEAKPVFQGEKIHTIEREEKNRAKQLIEDFMITANGVTARYLTAAKFPSLRRVVRAPKRWDRIVEIAREHEFQLPEVPDPKALDDFLVREKAADPVRFPDLSLAVIKLLGSGEYINEPPEKDSSDHFGLAVKDYAHSTAPNRRYPDLVTQRLLKAALEGKPVPYSSEKLDVLAAHCTKTEDAVNKVERRVGKSAAALLLASKIGEQFDSIVTGAAAKGTWVRLLAIPIEGKLVDGFEGLDVGERVRVQLIDTNIEQGFIDFKRAGPPRHL